MAANDLKNTYKGVLQGQMHQNYMAKVQSEQERDQQH
jgi:hypothetical protein